MVWTEIITTQVPNWVSIADSQTPNWTTVVT
jgi:hypothetical protein